MPFDLQKFNDAKFIPRTDKVPVPALQRFTDYDLGLSRPTHFEAFRIYVPWMAWDSRGAGLPSDFQVNGPVPVGGDEALDAKKASQLVAEIEPRVVIPLGGNVENFLKEMGSKAQRQDKLKITKKDLPQEGMQIFNIQA